MKRHGGEVADRARRACQQRRADGRHAAAAVAAANERGIENAVDGIAQAHIAAENRRAAGSRCAHGNRRAGTTATAARRAAASNVALQERQHRITGEDAGAAAPAAAPGSPTPPDVGAADAADAADHVIRQSAPACEYAGAITIAVTCNAASLDRKVVPPAAAQLAAAGFSSQLIYVLSGASRQALPAIAEGEHNFAM